MTKRYILLTALTIAAFIRADQAPDNAAEATRAGGASLEKSTFFYAQTFTASNAGTNPPSNTISTAGYYLLSGPATVAAGNPTGIIISGSNITLDLDGNSIVFGGGATKAISISTGAKNITIKNGTISGEFGNGAIYIGPGTSNVLLENITIDGPAGYGVHADGTDATTNSIKGLTLRNVQVSKCTKNGAAIYPIDINYAQAVALENINSIAAATTGSGGISGIRIQNSNSITGTGIVSSNHAGIAATIGLQMISCENVNLQEVNVSNNDDSTAASSSGLVLTTCNNVSILNLSADNLTKTLNNILIASSKNVTIENATASNSTNATSGAITSISMTGALSVLLRNVTVANNSAAVAATAYTGISTAGTCKNIRLENVVVQANAVASGANITGINLAETNGVEIIGCKVTHNQVTAGTTSQEAKGLNAASSVTDLIIRNSEFSANTAATGSTTATGGIVAGVYLNGVAGCEIYDSQANRNNGTGRAYGFYVTNINGLVMSGCTANSNAAAFANAVSGNDNMAMMPQEGSGTSADGIEALPSAGLYLLLCDYAEVKDCKFINNRAGNRAAGNLNAEGTPSVTSTCSGHGVANVGTTVVMMAVATLNIGNTFTRCIFQGNNTQIQDVAPAEPGMSYNGQNHWITETFAAGATEEFTSGTTYNDCLFNANGNSSKYVVGFGLCVFTGCNTLYVNNCTAATNGWYGFYDSTNAHIIALTGCISSMNGVGNSQATTAVGSANMRNYSLGGGVTPYKSVTVADFSQIAPTGSAYLNLSITP